MNEYPPAPPPAIDYFLIAARKEKKRRAARESLQDYIEYCMPDPVFNDPAKPNYDPIRSLYDCWPHHQLMIEKFERISKRICLRSGLSIPPQHGKTTVFAHFGIAWHAGRNPEDRIIYGTFNETRAGLVGALVMNLLTSERHKEVFPELIIRTGECSKFHVGFGKIGSCMFLGRGSGASGNPCDLFIIDDPYKGRTEARSAQIRAIVWDWYCSVVEARCPAQTPIAIIHTRWNDDDLLGHLCDPDHPSYSAEDNDEFEYLNIPAIVHDPALAALLDMEPGGALWPGPPDKPKWPLELLYKIKRKNPTSFSAVFMGNPIPPEGDFFTKDMIKGYYRRELPANIRKYGASDHAVSEKKSGDPSVIGCFALDESGEVWIMPDVSWRKITADKQVDEMVSQIRRHNPLTWWAEGDHIKKTLGPFLKMRLKAEKLFKTVFRELSKVGDKVEKAQAVRGMMAMGMVHLPIEAPWYDRAVAQLMRFDGSEGRPDDFVDFLANIGRGIDQMQIPRGEKKETEKMPETGTAGWVKMAARAEQRAARKIKALAGW